MEIQTKFHGVVTISEEKVICFPKGILGYPEETEFVIIPYHESLPFYILQSVKTPHVALFTMDPWKAEPMYEFDLNVAAKQVIQVETDSTELLTLGVVNIPDEFKKSRINLLAPIVIHLGNVRRGVQVVLENSPYSIRQPLFAMDDSETEGA